MSDTCFGWLIVVCCVSVLVIVGSMIHALAYIMSEAVMVNAGDEAAGVSVYVNCAIQGIVAATMLSIWQLMYRGRIGTRSWENLWQMLGLQSCELRQFWGTLLLRFLCMLLLRHFPFGATSVKTTMWW